MVYLIQSITGGILLGLLYTAIALGFTVVYRAGRTFNLAQGELIVIAAFSIWFVSTLLPASFWWAGLLVVAGLLCLLGLGIERIFRPLTGQSAFSLIMMVFGLLLFLRGCTVVIFGGDLRSVPEIIPGGTVNVGPFVYDAALFWGGLISLLIVAGLTLFFEKTNWGLRLAAVAEDHQIAQSLGISVNKSIALAWIVAALLAGFAAVSFLNDKAVTFVASDIGFVALPVVLLAGLESIYGVLVAGILVGIIESLTRSYIDPMIGGGLATVLPYVLMLIILLIRPQGLYGWKIIERV
jgi:branched-chain amino acid transport system permease protein